MTHTEQQVYWVCASTGVLGMNLEQACNWEVTKKEEIQFFPRVCTAFFYFQ
jgi:hypothetical protein